MKTTCENCDKAINTLVDFFTISGEDFHHCEACSQEDTDQEWGDLHDEDYGGTNEHL